MAFQLILYEQNEIPTGRCWLYITAYQQHRQYKDNNQFKEDYVWLNLLKLIICSAPFMTLG